MSKFELDEFVDDRYKTMSDRLAVRWSPEHSTW